MTWKKALLKSGAVCARRQIAAADCVVRDVRVGAGFVATVADMRAVTSTISAARKTQQVPTACGHIPTVSNAPNSRVMRSVCLGAGGDELGQVVE